jgi:hypothetical protein
MNNNTEYYKFITNYIWRVENPIRVDDLINQLSSNMVFFLWKKLSQDFQRAKEIEFEISNSETLKEFANEITLQRHDEIIQLFTQKNIKNSNHKYVSNEQYEQKYAAIVNNQV